MTDDWAKQTKQRQRANENARPKAVESREKRLEKQLKILADHAVLLHMGYLNAMAVVSSQNLIEWLKYMEGISTGLLRLEITPAEGLQRKYDQDRETDLYKTIMSGIRFKVRQQYQEDKFQP